MLVGNQIQQALHVAARLGIADELQDGPRNAHELAEATSANPGALARLLRALASVGIFTALDDGRFALTPLAAPLADGDGSVRPFALWSGGVSYQAFGALEHSVRTGEPAFEHLFGQEFFAYLADHPAAGHVFDAMMARHTTPVARSIAEIDLHGVETIVDLGGGRGDLLAEVLTAQPRLRGVLVEHPRLVDTARDAIAGAGLAHRCTVVGANILDAVPPGDAYLLKSVLHGLDDAAALEVLTRCRTGMSPQGVVLVIEFLLPEPNESSPAWLMDLLMLVGCHGRERSAEEFAVLFANAGLRTGGITPAKHGYQVIEARAA